MYKQVHKDRDNQTIVINDTTTGCMCIHTHKHPCIHLPTGMVERPSHTATCTKMVMNSEHAKKRTGREGERERERERERQTDRQTDIEICVHIGCTVNLYTTSYVQLGVEHSELSLEHKEE